MKLFKIFLSFFIVFLMLVTGTTDAIVQSTDCCSATATVCDTPVKLGPGTGGSSSFLQTSDYGAANLTAGLRFNETAAAAVSTPSGTAPALDGSAHAIKTDGNPTWVSCLLTTTRPNDIIYVIISILDTNEVVTNVSSPGTQLNWIQRGAVHDASGRVETWYAVASDPGTITITVNLAYSGIYLIVGAFGISGVNTEQPFDTSVKTSPVYGTGYGKIQSVSISTYGSNDLIIGAVATMANGGVQYSPVAGPGFALIYGGSAGKSTSEGGAGEYMVTSTPQQYLSVSFGGGKSNSDPWSMIADAFQGTSSSSPGSTPSMTVNTNLSAPSSASNSYVVPSGSSAYLWSPAYTNSTVIYNGSWVVDLWASKTTSGTMNVIVAAVDSKGTIVGTAVSGSTGTILTSRLEIKTTISGFTITVPAGGHLLLILSNPTGSGACTVYWGSNYVTNFQTPKDYDYIATITNSVSSQYSVSIMACSASSIGRLTNLTVSLHSPETTEVKVSNGVLTQSAGSSVTLSASSTLYVHAVATANAFGSSSITLLIKISTGSGPYFYQVLNLTVN